VDTFLFSSSWVKTARGYPWHEDVMDHDGPWFNLESINQDAPAFEVHERMTEWKQSERTSHSGTLLRKK